MTTPPTFRLSTCSDFLDELRGTVSDLKKDPMNPRLARYAAIVAWSMCDWVYAELRPQLNLKAVQNDVKGKCPTLYYIQDLANTIKHRNLRKPELAQLITAEKKGSFSRGFSRGFDIVRLELVLKDGRTLWFEDVIKEVLDFWDDYLREKNLIPTASRNS